MGRRKYGNSSRRTLSVCRRRREVHGRTMVIIEEWKRV
jgi:hypothetical protein